MYEIYQEENTILDCMINETVPSDIYEIEITSYSNKDKNLGIKKQFIKLEILRKLTQTAIDIVLVIGIFCIFMLMILAIWAFCTYFIKKLKYSKYKQIKYSR